MRFTWIPLYNELSDWLLLQRDNQRELIYILKEIGIIGFRDGSERGKEIELEEMDPFTFFSYLNKFHSDERRVEILQDLRRKLQFIHGKINHKNVLTALTSVMDNAELSGRAEDAMSDIEMFVKK